MQIVAQTKKDLLKESAYSINHGKESFTFNPDRSVSIDRRTDAHDRTLLTLVFVEF